LQFVQINVPEYFAPPAAELHSAAGALTACGTCPAHCAAMSGAVEKPPQAGFGASKKI